MVGRSASGKTSITREACKYLNLKQVKSYTTRPRREKETEETCDHYFISPLEVEKYSDKIVAWTEINGYEYFATKDELDNCDVYVIDPNGIEDLKSRCGNDYDFVIVYVRTTQDIAENRAKKRGQDIATFRERLRAEDAQFKDFEKSMGWHYHLLNNDTFERAVETMIKFMRKEFVL